jgi:hypothetical protein
MSHVKKTMTIWLAVALSLALVCPVLAQPGSGMGMGRGMGPRIYNPQTVTTVKGAVAKMEELPSMGRGGARGMRFRGVALKTDQGDITVHLGPAWYQDQKKFTVKVGDTMAATGSKVTLNQQPALLAREVTVNGKTLKLRDEQGIPLWRGTGMGPGAGSGQGPGGGK